MRRYDHLPLHFPKSCNVKSDIFIFSFPAISNVDSTYFFVYFCKMVDHAG